MVKNIITSLIIAVIVIVGGYAILMIPPSNSTQNTYSQANEQTQVPTAPPCDPNQKIVVPDNLKIEDTQVGTGKEAGPCSTVTMQYTGTLENGTKFDSSYDRNQPFTTQLGVGQVIKGWDLGVPGMKVGGKRRITIPPELGYGSSGSGPIPANSTLIFDVELLEVK